MDIGPTRMIATSAGTYHLGPSTFIERDMVGNEMNVVDYMVFILDGSHISMGSLNPFLDGDHSQGRDRRLRRMVDH